MRTGSGNRTVGRLPWERRKRHARQARSSGIHGSAQQQGRAPAVPPNAARGASATTGLLLSPPKPCSIPPFILWRKVLHPVWYHPLPESTPAPKAKLV